MISKFRILDNNQIDKVKWDEVVNSSEFTNYASFSYFLDAIFPNWKAIIYGDYDYIFPLTKGSKFGVNYLITPIFIPYIGVSSKLNIYPEFILEFIEFLKKQAKYIDLYFDPYTSSLIDSFPNEIRKGQVLSLDKPYDQIKSRYSSNHKRSLSKANKFNLTLKNSSNVKLFVSLFKENKGHQLKELKDFNYSALTKALEKSIENGSGFLLDCYQNENHISSAFFMVVKNRITYIKGFSSKEGRDKGAMHFILDFVISDYSLSGKTFDFGGSNSPQVAKFNTGFGAHDIYYQNYKKNSLPFILKMFKS